MSPTSRLDRLCTLPDLRASWQSTQARGCRAGTDGVSVEAFGQGAEQRLIQWASGDLPAPGAALAFDLPKVNGSREVIRLSVQDRVLEGAAMRALGRLLTPDLHPTAYAYRAGRGAHDALSAVARAVEAGLWMVRLDVRECFASIPQGQLLARLAPLLSEQASSELRAMIGRPLSRAGRTALHEHGLLEGSLLSPMLSNWYLRPLDEALSQRAPLVVRYADDVVALVPNPLAAAQLVETAHQSLGDLHLELNRSKTRVGPVEAGFTFLGFTLSPGVVRVAPERLAALKADLQERLAAGNLQGAQALLKGWKAYYQLGQVAEDVRALDAWLETQTGAPRFPPVRETGSDLPRVSAPRTSPGVRLATFPLPVVSIQPGGSEDERALLDLARLLAVQPHPAAQAAALLSLRWPADPTLKLEQVLVAVKASARAQMDTRLWAAREAACDRLQAELGPQGSTVAGALRAERLMQECLDPVLRLRLA